MRNNIRKILREELSGVRKDIENLRNEVQSLKAQIQPIPLDVEATRPIASRIPDASHWHKVFAINDFEQRAETVIAPTVRSLASGEWLTADDVAQLTTKSRNLESGYLNSLADAGITEKKREGKKVFFRLTTQGCEKLRERYPNIL